jgi:hypothetical protein
MAFNMASEANKVLDVIRSDSKHSGFVDWRYGVPAVFQGEGGPIRLIILGQDPTVKDEESRKHIHQVLNLDKDGRLKAYLNCICSQLGLILEKHVYATNYFKNFFINRPTQIEGVDIFQAFRKYWFPLLKKELAQFPNVPVISLGEPLLKQLVKDERDSLVRDYWGYVPDWKQGITGEFKYIAPDKNHLNRQVFPFPHQPSISKKFYCDRFDAYTSYVKKQTSSLRNI